MCLEMVVGLLQVIMGLLSRRVSESVVGVLWWSVRCRDLLSVSVRDVDVSGVRVVGNAFREGDGFRGRGRGGGAWASVVDGQQHGVYS